MADMTARGGLIRSEPLAAVAGAGALAALLVWLGPQGTDLAAHAYQRALYLNHGFLLWNNFWYAGRYSFVTYSVLYYPLAALLGIRVLAVLTVVLAVAAFAAVARREWGLRSRWSSRRRSRSCWDAHSRCSRCGRSSTNAAPGSPGLRCAPSGRAHSPSC